MSPYADDDPIKVEQSSPKMDGHHVPVTASVLVIVVSLTLGALPIWLIHFDWVLEQIAALVLVGVAVVGGVAGRFVYKFLDQGILPKWAKLTSAIILGISVFITADLLVHSHKLIRDYEHFSSDYDDGP